MSFKKCLLFILLAELLCAALALNNHGFSVEALQATTRFSGRLSLLLFSPIFLLLPFEKTKLHALLSDKPFHIFAIAHGIHLIEVFSFVYLSNGVLIPLRVAGGFLAYAFIFAMPLMDQKHDQKQLSDNQYTLFQNIYVYYVWFIFFMSYLPRVQGKLPHVGGSYSEFVVLLTLVCALMGSKILSVLKLSFISKK